MARFRITAVVTVDVEMEIEATDAAAAEKLFHDKIAVDATLVDTPKESFMVEDDSIMDMDVTGVDAV